MEFCAPTGRPRARRCTRRLSNCWCWPMPAAATAPRAASGRSACRRWPTGSGDPSRSAICRRATAKRTLGPAPVTDRFTTEVTITDPAHPFFGQWLPTLFQARPGRRDHVRVKLPGGGRRSIPIAATSLAAHSSTLGDRTEPSPSLVSVRTLLPLVHLVRALERRRTEVPDAAGHYSMSTDAPQTCDDGTSAAAVAGSPRRRPTAPGSPRGQARRPHAPQPRQGPRPVTGSNALT